MDKLILRTGFYFIGLAGILIGLSFIVFGVHTTGQVFANIVGIFYDGGSLTGLDNPNADSELRFYSIFWIAYGVLLIQTARDLSRYAARVPWLIGAFFLGGLARLISYFSIGAPHILFIFLMIIELVSPTVLFLCWSRVRQQNGDSYVR